MNVIVDKFTIKKSNTIKMFPETKITYPSAD